MNAYIKSNRSPILMGLLGATVGFGENALATWIQQSIPLGGFVVAIFIAIISIVVLLYIKHSKGETSGIVAFFAAAIGNIFLNLVYDWINPKISYNSFIASTVLAIMVAGSVVILLVPSSQQLDVHYPTQHWYTYVTLPGPVRDIFAGIGSVLITQLMILLLLPYLFHLDLPLLRTIAQLVVYMLMGAIAALLAGRRGIDSFFPALIGGLSLFTTFANTSSLVFSILLPWYFKLLFLTPDIFLYIILPLVGTFFVMGLPSYSFTGQSGQSENRMSRRALLGEFIGIVVACYGIDWLGHTLTNHLLVMYRSNSPVFTLAWSPDDSRIVSSSGYADVWNSVTGKRLFRYSDQIRVMAVAWSPNGKYIASASQQGTVQVWDVATGKKLVAHSYPEMYDYYQDIAWAPDGKAISSTSSDTKVVQVWSASSGRDIVNFGCMHGRTGSSHVWSPQINEQHLATVCYNDNGPDDILIWDVPTKNLLHSYQVPSDLFSPYQVAWAPDGQFIAVGGFNELNRVGIVHVWKVSTGQLINSYTGHSDLVYSVAWSPNGERIASASQDKTVQIWDAFTGQNAFTYNGHVSQVNTVAWSHAGTRIASGSNDGTVQVWKAP